MTALNDTERPIFQLTADNGQSLHESGTTLTAHRAYAWRGNRDDMRKLLDDVPEGLRKRLRPLQIAAPRPVGRA